MMMMMMIVAITATVAACITTIAFLRSGNVYQTSS